MTLGIVVLVFGAVWFLLGWFDKREDRRFDRSGQRVPGRVIDLVTYPNDDSLQSGQYKLIVEYELEGERYTCKSRHGSMNWSQEIGTAYDVLVDPADPRKARLAIDMRIGPSYWGYLIVVAAGVVFILADLLDW